MEIFIRILSYADFIIRRLVFFFLYSILGTIFSVFNIVLVIPMLKLLFSQSKSAIDVPPIPEFNFSPDYIIGLFNHYNLLVIRDYGQLNALLFICSLIVTRMIFGNFFPFLERVLATKFWATLLKNLLLL